MLQSRAWDEAGNVQPTRAEVIAQRGQTKAPVTDAAGVPEPALQRPDELGDRADRRGEACLRVS